MAELTPGDRVTAEDVTVKEVRALLEFLARCDCGGRTHVPTWEIRTVLAGGVPS